MQLPNEILLIIFDFCDLKTKFNWKQVNSSWNTIHIDTPGILFKHLLYLRSPKLNLTDFLLDSYIDSTRFHREYTETKVLDIEPHVTLVKEVFYCFGQNNNEFYVQNSDWKLLSKVVYFNKRVLIEF
jgi:hypothetical protein